MLTSISTCIHFITVILSTRGMFEGQDSFPVFHVTPLSTLAHTVAKLVATKSHRMWITEPISPSNSGPPTPSLHTATLVPTSSHSSALSHSNTSTLPVAIAPPPSDPFSTSPGAVIDHSPKTPFINPSGPSISASALPGARISGRLVGVVSLTDILILFARAGGLGDVVDPSELRLRRRRSSSSSVRRSVDLGSASRVSLSSDAGAMGRGSGLRPSGELSRKGSSSNR
jgi:CBS domain-containing protein